MSRFRKICPYCGGRMIYESICEYGLKHYITDSGRVSKRASKVDYGGVGLELYYCDQCGWSPYEDSVVGEKRR